MSPSRCLPQLLSRWAYRSRSCSCCPHELARPAPGRTARSATEVAGQRHRRAVRAHRLGRARGHVATGLIVMVIVAIAGPQGPGGSSDVKVTVALPSPIFFRGGRIGRVQSRAIRHETARPAPGSTGRRATEAAVQRHRRGARTNRLRRSCQHRGWRLDRHDQLHRGQRAWRRLVRRGQRQCHRARTNIVWRRCIDRVRVVAFGVKPFVPASKRSRCHSWRCRQRSRTGSSCFGRADRLVAARTDRGPRVDGHNHLRYGCAARLLMVRRGQR